MSDDTVDLTNTEDDVDTDVVYNPARICRGCLKENDDMKNIYESGIAENFFTYMDIPRNPLEGMLQLLCKECETNLQNVKSFKDMCQASDKILKKQLKKRMNNYTSIKKNQVITVLSNKKLTFLITAPNPEEKIGLKCPHKKCDEEFQKKSYLLFHLRKDHKISPDFEIEQQYFCTESSCAYSMTSYSKKCFMARKHLNQHYNKMHKDKIYKCSSCNRKYSRRTDYERHLRSCDLIFICEECNVHYNSSESYLVHLMRRHPELHAKYKEEKKAKKREIEIDYANCDLPAKVSKRKSAKATETQHASDDEMSQEEDLQEETDTMDTDLPSLPSLPSLSSIPSLPSLPSLQNEEFEDQNTIPSLICIPDGDSAIPDGDSAIPDAIEEQVIQETDNSEPTEQREIEISFIDLSAPGAMVDKMTGSDEVPLLNIDPRYIETTTVEVSTEIEAFKKSSGTQVPEEITDDISLTPWTNRSDFEFQNEMSTQTGFEDFLSKSQNNEEDIYLSETVALSDIQTQTAPFEFGLSRSNKTTQSCTSQTQSPDFSIKETQTCVCHFDSNDFRTAVRSDVLLSFSSAETQTIQTCFEESRRNM